MWRSNIAPDRISPTGFARFVPASEGGGAVGGLEHGESRGRCRRRALRGRRRCRRSGRPRAPRRCRRRGSGARGPRSDPACWISCMQSASMIRSSNATGWPPRSASAVRDAACHLEEQPVGELHDVRLVRAVTSPRPRRRASSNANRTMRSVPSVADRLDRQAAVLADPAAGRVLDEADQLLRRGGAHLELEPRVGALDVLADDDEVDLVVDRRDARRRAGTAGRSRRGPAPCAVAGSGCAARS